MNKDNIFISYGHNTYDDIIRKVAEDIRKCNYEVFVDVDYLKQGDWEKIIDNHIKDSKFFLFFISKKSTSQDGYCLNELCRAGEIGATIIPIKLDESLTPLSINKYQRLNLEECINPDGQLIESKYQQFLIELLNIIQNKNKLGFSNDEIRLKNCLKPVSSREDLFRFYSNFCGRKKAFEVFENFLASDKNILWFYARPGFGKTAFSSMLCWNYPDAIGAIHFCKFNNSDRTNSKIIFTSIAYHLSNFIPEYKTKLINLPDLDTIFEKNASRILEYLILEQLYDIHLSKPVVIILDALDECSWRGENEICDILQRAYRNNEIPSWLKFVITSRNEAEIRRYLLPVSQVSDALEVTSEDDLREYYHKQFPDINEEIVSRLLSKSEGSFLYASEICKQIKSDKISLNDINFFPVGIYGFFRDCFDRIFGSSQGNSDLYKEVKPLLEFMCITPKSVDEDFLCEVLGYDKYRLREILIKLSGLFPIKNKCIEPLHKSLIDWLTDESDVSHIYYIEKIRGYKTLYNYYKKKYDSHEYLSDKGVLESFGKVLIELNKKDELFDLLNDFDFQMAKIKYLFFDSGLESYIDEITWLYDPNDNEKCLNIFKGEVFKTIFSNYRRILYNSGLFFNLKEIGLSVALKTEGEWNLEGEIGKVFYYYIVENFERAISKAKALITKNEEIKSQPALLAEVLNVKGLSQRKIVEFDEALESFDKAIEYAKTAIEDEYIGDSDPSFEISLSHLIKGKIYTNMINFHEANKNYKKAIKYLSNNIEEMGNCDRKISNTLFLAEDYRVFADSLIWEGEYDDASEKLKECEDIYVTNKQTMDRYYIRFKYTTQLLLTMSNDVVSAINNLKALLANKIKGKYDNGQINMILALAILLNKNNESYEEGLEHAKKAADIFENIDASMEANMANLIVKKLYNKQSINKKVDFDFENEYIENWINHVEEIIDKKLGD